METWYKDLIANPKRAHDCFVHDYNPIASILATLSGMVLDVGGGIGLVRHYLPRGTEYIVIDPSLQWLMAEWSSLSEHFPCLKNLPNFVRGIGEYLPFPARRFDTVLACWSLNHASNPQQVFREVWRVLRPRGRFLIILEDMVTDENPGDQPIHLSHGTLGLGHLNGGRSLSCFNDPAAPLQSDHIRILESDIAAWASEIFEITQRSWIGQYLTFELTRIQSTEQLTRAGAW
jgi:ubiquinone/menaquinone biosynthesis C-methylase UbiE